MSRFLPEPRHALDDPARTQEGPDPGPRSSTAATPEGSSGAAGRVLVELATRRLAHLQRVTAAFGKAFYEADVHDVVVAEMVSATGAAAGSIALLDDELGEIRVVRATGYEPEVLERFQRFPVDAEVPIAVAIREGAPVLVGAIAGTPGRFPQAAEAARVSGRAALAALPLTVGDRTVGAIGLSFRDPQSFDDDHVAFLLALARQCSAALERTRLLSAEAEARSRLELLAQVSGSLAGTLSVDEILGHLARGCVPRFADACLGFLLEDGAVRPALAYDHDPDRETTIRALVERLPVDLDAELGTGAAMRTGRSSRLVITPEVLARANAPAEAIEAVRSLQLNAGIFVPLTARGRTLGAVSFLTFAGRSLTTADIAIAEELVRRAAVAIDNARLLQEQERAAASLRFQTALLDAQAEAGLDGLLVVSPDGEMLSFNQRFADMWGLDEATLASRSDDVALDRAAELVEDPEAFLADVRATYRDPGRPRRDEVRLRDGRVLDRYGAPLRATDGTYLGYSWSFRDVTNQKRVEAELRAAGERHAALARTLQRSLLPPSLPDVRGVELAAAYHPGREGLDVGGDFYDVFALDEETWVLVIGDVCGKGEQAASVTAMARHTIRAAAAHTRSPAEVLRQLNDVVLRSFEADDELGDGDPLTSRFCTVGLATMRLRAGHATVRVACGGHSPPYLLTAGGTVRPVGTPGTIIGAFAEIDVHEEGLVLDAGDRLVLMTDGILEARDPSGAQLGDAGVQDLLRTVPGPSASSVTSRLAEAAITRQGGLARDDIAVLVARVTA